MTVRQVYANDSDRLTFSEQRYLDLLSKIAHMQHDKQLLAKA